MDQKPSKIKIGKYQFYIIKFIITDIQVKVIIYN